MELRQLQYFLAVVEEENFTRGAERVHVAQPGVSSQIRRLERELGHALLDRSGRSVKPTPAGEAVLPHVRAALAAVAGVRHAVDELTGLLRGQVTVGMVTRCTALDVPAMLAGFSAEHPAIEVALLESDSSSLAADVAAGTVDVAIVGASGPPPESLSSESLVEEPLVAVVAADDPVARGGSLSLAELTGRRLIGLPVGTGSRTELDRACSAAGLSPRVAFEASDPRVLSDFAGRGFGTAVLPASVAVTDTRLQRVVPIDDSSTGAAAMTVRLDLLWRRTPGGPAARALVEHVRGSARRRDRASVA